jgi:hypothetical protein
MELKYVAVMYTSSHLTCPLASQALAHPESFTLQAALGFTPSYSSPLQDTFAHPFAFTISVQEP